MSTTTTVTLEQRVDDALHAQELPAIAPADRLALRAGTRLILWGEHRGRQRADRDARAEQSRLVRASEHAGTAADRAFEHRAHAGTTW